MSTSAEQIQTLSKKISSNLRVSMPAKIEDYDFKTQKASVKIDLRELYDNDTSIDYPVITDVPVIFPRSGGASLTMPVERGDTCLLVFLDRDLTAWLAGASGKTPNSRRYHNINDAVAIMGLIPFSKPSLAENNEDVMLAYKQSKIRIKKDGKIEIESKKEVYIEAKDVKLKCDNASIKASKKIEIESANEITIKAKNILINCENASIKASNNINAETPVFTQKGKLKIDGDLEVSGSSLINGNSTMKGDANIYGNTTCGGTLKGESVKTNSGIDLKSHTHSYKEAQSGSNPTVVVPSVTGAAC